MSGVVVSRTIAHANSPLSVNQEQMYRRCPMEFSNLLTTELGLLDACARISTDIIKTNWLRTHAKWTRNRLYFLLLRREYFA